MNYYRTFDLSDAGRKIKQLGDDRGNHEVFADAIQSLLIVAQDREVKCEELEQVLGEPDRVRPNETGDVWEYDWSDTYGPVNYTSSTPLQVSAGVCKGLALE